jgi:hypothetical protein
VLPRYASGYTTLTVPSDSPYATGEKKYVFKPTGMPFGKVLQVLPHRMSNRIKILHIETPSVGGPVIERPVTREGLTFPWDAMPCR